MSGLTVLEGRKLIFTALMFLAVHSFTSVSYTHLDVYKRQPFVPFCIGIAAIGGEAHATGQGTGVDVVERIEKKRLPQSPYHRGSTVPRGKWRLPKS